MGMEILVNEWMNKQKWKIDLFDPFSFLKIK